MIKASLLIRYIVMVGLLLGPACSASAEEAADASSEQPIESSVTPLVELQKQSSAEQEGSVEGQTLEPKLQEAKKQKFYKDKRFWIGATVVGLCALGAGLFLKKDHLSAWYRNKQINARYEVDLDLDAKRKEVYGVIEAAESQGQLSYEFKNLRLRDKDFGNVIDNDLAVKKHFLRKNEELRDEIYLDAKRYIVHGVIEAAESQEQLINDLRNLRLTCHDFRDIIDGDVDVRKHFLEYKKKLPLRILTTMDKIKDGVNAGFQTAGKAAQAAAPVVIEVAKRPEFWQLMIDIIFMMLK